MNMTCGEATMRLLARYGITTAFGIPGVHTLDLCRGMTNGTAAKGDNAGTIRHVQVRNEQGAGFMAEGWARATGEVGLAVVISGPGVTNASTAVAQCHADSLPMLLISAEPDRSTIGKGWGVLHEITEQRRVTEPLCAYSGTAMRASDVPEMLARAFSNLSSKRPRPCHISLPLDVQAEIVEEDWLPAPLPGRPSADPEQVAEAAALLGGAENPLILVGGGAVGASPDMTAIAEATGAIVVASTAGKGIVPDDHPQSLSGSSVR
ncbi:MAG: decarboxylase, partial [Boseongicola sp. SB0670_bin_30]|nr:decarboxylase [Boseongicola sp. SB0670_bin_30]